MANDDDQPKLNPFAGAPTGTGAPKAPSAPPPPPPVVSARVGGPPRAPAPPGPPPPRAPGPPPPPPAAGVKPPPPPAAAGAAEPARLAVDFRRLLDEALAEPDPFTALEPLAKRGEDVRVRRGVADALEALAAEPDPDDVPLVATITMAAWIRLGRSQAPLEALCRAGKGRAVVGKLPTAPQHFALAALHNLLGEPDRRFDPNRVIAEYGDAVERTDLHARIAARYVKAFDRALGEDAHTGPVDLEVPPSARKGAVKRGGLFGLIDKLRGE